MPTEPSYWYFILYWWGCNYICTLWAQSWFKIIVMICGSCLLSSLMYIALTGAPVIKCFPSQFKFNGNFQYANDTSSDKIILWSARVFVFRIYSNKPILQISTNATESTYMLRVMSPQRRSSDVIWITTRAFAAWYHWSILWLDLIMDSGTHFTNDFSITIQIRWKFHLALIQLLMIISRQNLAHATTAQLSCHVPNIVAITFLVFGWEQNEISITFELWWKNC